MKAKKAAIFAIIGAALIGTVAYAALNDARVPVEFFKGHSHEDGKTVGAPEHSGGTNSQGCHNGSVPYHCH